jgi:hypothetical protein
MSHDGVSYALESKHRPTAIWGAGLPVAIVNILLALLVLFRLPDWRVARLLFCSSIGAAILFTGFMGLNPVATHVSLAILTLAYPLWAMVIFRICCGFPRGSTPLEPWQAALCWFFGLSFGLIALVYLWISPAWFGGWAMVGAGVLVLIFNIALLWMLTRSFPPTDHFERRQLKLILLALTSPVCPS